MLLSHPSNFNCDSCKGLNLAYKHKAQVQVDQVLVGNWEHKTGATKSHLLFCVCIL